MYYVIRPIFYIISYLPWKILYLISDILNFIVFTVLSYRKKIIRSNLQIAFPNKSLSELEIIEKDFYRNFIDNFIETIKFLTISDADIKKRVQTQWEHENWFENQNQPTVILMGHLMNWELISLVFGTKIPYPSLTVYMHLSNKFFDRLMIEIRSKRKLILLRSENFSKEFLKYRRANFTIALAADQNPPNPQDCLWLDFFGQKLPFTSGPEQISTIYNARVLYLQVTKVKRGFYETSLKCITTHARNENKMEITKKYISCIEENIAINPANYLWTHNRFKYRWEDFKDKFVTFAL